MPPGKRLRILLAVPCERYLPIQFAQSILWAVQDPELEIIPYLVGSTVVHLARSDAIGVVREDKSFDFLCFVDSDQIFSKLTIRRLVTWGVPVVAPVVVQRQGDPIPVAYKEIARDDKGMWRYESLIGPIVAYLSQFGERWWDGPTGILPLVPDCIGPSMAVPDEVAAGCNHPLLPCDAVGAGMVLFRRDVVDSLQPDEHGLFCLPGDTRVSIRGGLTALRGVSRRYYNGELVEIETRAGYKLSGTPNHPILTPEGWRPLGEFQEGDEAVCAGRCEEVGLGYGHEDEVDTPIREVFDLAAGFGLVQRYTGSNHQFHGDGQDGDVDVVRPDRELGDEGEAAFLQPADEYLLARAGLGTPSLPRYRPGDVLLRASRTPAIGASAFQVSPSVLAVGSHRYTGGVQKTVDARRVHTDTLGDAVGRLPILVRSHDLVSMLHQPSVAPGHCVAPALPSECAGKTTGLGTAADRGAGFVQKPSDSDLGDTVGRRDVRGRFSQQIALDQVVSVRRLPFSGHVYNLHTRWGHYTAQHIIVANCGFASGGEDLDICRRTRAAGWGGCVPGERGWGIFVDRGCFIGHLTSYSRGIHDMLALAQARSQQSSKQDAALASLPPAVPDLVNALHAQGNGRALPAPEWAGITLPGE